LPTGADGSELAATRLVEYALIQAAGHDGREIVQFLLSKNRT
jgi:hypothetical protein